MKENKLFLLFHALALYLSWWVSFWGVSIKQYYTGLILVIIYFLIHFILITNKFKEFKYMICCIIVGIVLDSFFYCTGFISYNGLLVERLGIIPFWTVLLLGGYAVTVYHTFSWILNRYYLSLILGMLLIPLIYISGDRIGVVILNKNLLESYLVLASIFGFYFLFFNYLPVVNND